MKILHPFTPFDDNTKYYDDKASTVYYTNVWAAIIKDFEEHGIIPAGKVTPDESSGAAPIWHQMVDYRAKTDELLDQGLEGKSLDRRQGGAARPRRSVFYGNYDFLDAYRLASAADELTADGRAGDGRGRRGAAPPARGRTGPPPRRRCSRRSIRCGSPAWSSSWSWLAAADPASCRDHRCRRPLGVVGRLLADFFVGAGAGLLRR